MKGKKEYMELVKKTVDFARKKGADAAEAVIMDSSNAEIAVSAKAVEQVKAYDEAGIGIRILKDQKMIFGSSNDLSWDSITDMISGLILKVPYHTPDEFNVFASEKDGILEKAWSSCTDRISFDPKIAEVPVEKKIKRALRLEAAGLEFSPKVKGSMYCLYRDGIVYTYFANSQGISGWYPSSSCGGGIALSAAEGDDQQSGSHQAGTVKYDDFDPEAVGKKAAKNAVSMLGAKPLESCEVPMVVTPEVGTSLFGYIVGMLSADAVQKGKSLFADMIGKAVASKYLTLIDDGTLKGGLDTNPVDGEGVPRQVTPLIVDGMLKNYLYDCYNAKRGKVKSTGNRSRSSYANPGRIDCTNLYMKAGKEKPEKIIASIDKGFYLDNAFGLHAGIDSTSGDFSIPISGFKIEKGEITSPVRGVSIGGNLFEFLKAVDKVGDDLTWTFSLACPTFSVKNVKIGGSKV